MHTLAEMLESNAVYHASREAFVFEDRRLTHAQFADRARRLGSALSKHGTRRQDRVSVLAMNCLEYYETYAANEIAGFITAPVNFRLAPPEIAYILGDIAPHVLVFEAQYTDVVARLRPSLTAKHYVCIGGPAPEWAAPYEEFVATGEPGGPPLRANEDDFAYLFYTSGTTGRPKGVVHTHQVVCSSAARCSLVSNMDSSTRVLQTTPAFHVGGKGYVNSASWVAGMTVLHRGFDPIKALSTIEQERITFTFMVAAMLQAFLEVPGVEKRDLTSMSRIVSAAAPIPAPLLRRGIEVLGPIFSVQYGSTEGNSITHLQSHFIKAEGTPEELALLKSVGHPCPDVLIRIVDDQGRECPRNVPGEVWVKSDGIFSAYWNNSVQTNETLKDGWYLTGDIGYLNEKGFIFLVDRKKDMIISGGENIYSKEVEDALAAHPAVFEAAVIGYPDPKWVEVVKAVVILRENKTVTEAELIAHCKTLIASYKCPKLVSFVTEMPRVGSGKMDKVALRKLYGRQT